MIDRKAVKTVNDNLKKDFDRDIAKPRTVRLHNTFDNFFNLYPNINVWGSFFYTYEPYKQSKHCVEYNHNCLANGIGEHKIYLAHNLC